MSQLNIDLTSKVNRLEQSNQELSQDYKIYYEKAQSLEMELEMTKANSERDIENLLD